MDVSRPVKCMPDVIIYLDVKIDTALKRIINNRKVLKYRDEKLSVLRKMFWALYPHIIYISSKY